MMKNWDMLKYEDINKYSDTVYLHNKALAVFSASIQSKINDAPFFDCQIYNLSHFSNMHIAPYAFQMRP